MDGKRFELDLEKAFRAAGVRAVRPRQDRPVDVGDLWVGDDVVVQAKAWRNLAQAVREGLAGAQAQKRRAHRPIGVAIAKQAYKPVEEAVVAMTFGDLLLLLQSRETPGQ
ncbi:holliday junction resolvase [Microbacterium phage Quenya]|uniref:holliday junction resolvase n=1 Tax=Microbacterium phage Quenya TaxID=2776868 RepID=UPI0018A49BB2|nr:holliday junction resolvase [Microbacterium phage Quenya]QOP64271.1 holliday junction resolvase [Microbacterium phage Quenya]